MVVALMFGAKLSKDRLADRTFAETPESLGMLEPYKSFPQRQIAFTYFLERRFEEALEELEKYFGMVDSPSAYALIWKNLFLEELGKRDEAQQFLELHAKRFDSEDWEAYLFRYHQGTVTASRLLSRASNSGERCETYFYIGYQYLLNGDNEKAREYFQKTIETKVDMYYEYTAARARLKQLDAR